MFNKIKVKKYMLITVAFLMLFGCSVSESDVLSQSENTAYEMFVNENTVETNHEAKQFRFYLPSGFEIESESDNNVLITKGKQSYILFVNPLESKESQTVFESTIMNKENNVLKKTFVENNEFGFIYIRSIEGKQYEVSVGVGGVKMTTQTNGKELAESTETMMQIVKSVEY